ncbi:hypothetical protein HN415_00770 [Candidatus Woesearchaeota archaeon]|jgi:hypothetical protein|nr:hypothetical protein [Candidatus Woesearchaeota archaeon]
MKYKQNNNLFKIGKFVGFTFSYFLSVTILFLIINIFKKSLELSYFFVMVLILMIIFVGFILRKVLS